MKAVRKESEDYGGKDCERDTFKSVVKGWESDRWDGKSEGSDCDEVQNEVNQEESEQNEVDGMKKG